MKKIIIAILFFASFAIAQYYKIIIDSQIPNRDYVIKIYSGDYLFVKADFFENKEIDNLSADWQMFFSIYREKYTNVPIMTIPGVWYTNNGVAFTSTNSINEHGKYYFTIRGTNSTIGANKIWASGKIIVDSIGQ